MNGLSEESRWLEPVCAFERFLVNRSRGRREIRTLSTISPNSRGRTSP